MIAYRAHLIEAIDICTSSEWTHLIMYLCPSGYINDFSWWACKLIHSVILIIFMLNLLSTVQREITR